jgi:hypothetical protein
MEDEMVPTLISVSNHQLMMKPHIERAQGRGFYPEGWMVFLWRGGPSSAFCHDFESACSWAANVLWPPFGYE